MPRGLARLALAAALLPSLGSCSYLFTVGVAPTADGPRFDIGTVRRLIAHERPGCASQLVVREESARETLWVIRNDGPCSRLTSFVYGRVPKGWTEQAPARPLRPGVAYYVLIGAGGGTGGASFLADGTDLSRTAPRPPL